MKISRVRILLWVLVALWCGVIFCFSAETGAQSSVHSQGIVSEIYEVVSPDMTGKTDAQQAEYFSKVETVIRKLAHFTAYGVLGMLVFFAANGRKSRKVGMAVGIIFVFIYACTDEFHQSFTPNRSPEFRDVCIDTLGALFWICIAIMVMKVIRRQINKKLGEIRQSEK